ncbi:unnamed protein product [Diamesa hyperborea]
MKEVLISLTICLLIVTSIGAPHDSSQDDGSANPRQPFQYKYEVKDEAKKLFFDKNEEGDEDGTVTGRYSVLLPDGRLMVVEYTADKNGYHPRISYEPNANPFSDRLKDSSSDSNKNSNDDANTLDDSSASYCAENVKKFDYENFLCTLLMNGESRRDALAIRAFNVEIAKIPTMVSDNKIGLVRLKFWEEALVKLYDKNKPHLPDHPVVKELDLVLNRNKLTKRYFDRLINARKKPNFSFVTSQQMENYAEETISSVNFLILELLNCRNVNADHAASHLGKAQGIANILRSIYAQRIHSQHLPIPQEILMKHGISQERFYRSKLGDKGVEEVVFEIATLAHQHLEKSSALMSKVPKECNIAFLPAITTKRYLERLRRVNFHLSDKRLGVRDNLLPLALYWNKFKGVK